MFCVISFKTIRIIEVALHNTNTMPPNLHAEAFAHLRKESLDIYNRIHSIQEDIAFVDTVREAYPTLTMLREYVPPLFLFMYFMSFLLALCLFAFVHGSSESEVWRLVYRSCARRSSPPLWLFSDTPDHGPHFLWCSRCVYIH